MKTHFEEIRTGLKHFLEGYGRRDMSALQTLAANSNWQAQAQTELARRATHLLENLADRDLEAVAAGEVDIAALASEVAQTLEKQAG